MCVCVCVCVFVCVCVYACMRAEVCFVSVSVLCVVIHYFNRKRPKTLLGNEK